VVIILSRNVVRTPGSRTGGLPAAEIAAMTVAVLKGLRLFARGTIRKMNATVKDHRYKCSVNGGETPPFLINCRCDYAADLSRARSAGRRRSNPVRAAIARRVGGLMWCSIPSTSW